MAKIKPRERSAIIQSLRAGVTPRVGLEHIQVGRVKEIKALIEDLNEISDGGSFFRIVVGDFGAGKTFFLQLVRYLALEKGLVVVNADLNPDRRLYSTSGHARNLYQELIHNLATRAHPEGNALSAVLERFITEQRKYADEHDISVDKVIRQKLLNITTLVGGYDFANAVVAYWHGYENDDEDKKQAALRFLRGEYRTLTEAKEALNIKTAIKDCNIYDYLKLLAKFVTLAGYKGLLVNLDEMVNLYKLHNTKSRVANYEQILRILNDCLQGSAENIGFILGGTTEFLEDSRKGLYSYEALRSRLCLNSFATVANVVDYKAPVLPLKNLSPEELFVLLTNIRRVFANGDESKYLIPDEAITAFLEHCSKHIGEAYFRTPRNTVKAFVDFLSILEQNPELKWSSLLESVSVTQEVDDSIGLSDDDEDSDLDNDSENKSSNNDNDDDLSTFTL